MSQRPSKPDPFGQLTAREAGIARQVAAGHSNKVIAADSGISERTVKAHLNSIFRKTGIRNRVQLALAVSQAISPARGLHAVSSNTARRDWAVVTEAIQTVPRREGYPRPYEALKALTRTHKTINQEALAEFVASLDVSPAVKDELLNITPENYTGIIKF